MTLLTGWKKMMCFNKFGMQERLIPKFYQEQMKSSQFWLKTID